MRLNFLILYMIFQKYNQQCNQGCLSCNSINLCMICDSYNNYYLKGSTCISILISNCQKISQQGICLYCISGYYIDQNTLKCVSFSSTAVISNCQFYNTNIICTQCKTGYYVANNQCLAVSSVIQNCAVQGGLTGLSCLQCNTGYFSSIDRLSCKLNPTGITLKNCSQMSLLQCKSCQASYFLNKNYYLNILSNSNNFINLAINQPVLEANSFFPICQLNVPNCLVMANSIACKTCQANFKLNSSGTCEQNPIQQIKFCSTYSSPMQCQTCQIGYILTNPSLCTPQSPIANCSVYDSNSINLRCNICKSTFLQSGGFCSKRQITQIKNCLSMNPYSEGCSICKTGFVPTTDGLKCLNQIKNCGKYNTSSLKSIFLFCQVCSKGYYFNDQNICTKGTILNCVVYHPNANICDICLNGFYISGNLCLLSNKDPLCLVYDKLIKNKCKQCRSDSVLLTVVNSCVVNNSILNCEFYYSTNTCSQCLDGFYLKNPFTCLKLDPNLNCLTYLNSKCTKCVSGFNLNGGKCIQPSTIVTSNCLTTNIDGLKDASSSLCINCNPGSILYNFIGTGICVNRSEINTISNPNCLSYKKISSKFVCAQCQQALSNGICYSKCPTSGTSLHTHILDVNNSYISVASVNECRTQNIQRCNLSSPQIIQNDLTLLVYSCVLCNLNSLTVITLDNMSQQFTLIRPIPNYIYSPVDKFFPIQSCQPSSSSILGSFTKQNSCEYFSQIPNASIFYCIKCSFGQKGVVVPLVNFCKTYIQNSLSCSVCNDGYKLISDYQCVFDGQTNCTQSSNSCGACNSLKPDTSIIKCNQISAINPGYIDSCSQMTGCLNQFYSGFSAVVNSLLSCHVCSDPTKIPYIAFRGGDPYQQIFGLQSYNINSSGSYNSQIGGYSTDCIEPIASSFGSTNNFFNFPQNCAVAGININASQDSSSSANLINVDLSKIGVICIGCKFGYRAKYAFTVVNNKQVLVPNMIAVCELIQNCSSSIWFNYCSSCLKNFAYYYDSNFGVKYDQCVQSTPNCYAQNNSECIICNNGYFLNGDQICEQFQAPQCLQQSQSPKIVLRSIDIPLLLTFQKNMPGCQNCGSLLSLQLTTNTFICKKQSYITGSLPTQTVFVQNCLQYSAQNISNIYFCAICTLGFIVTTKGKCVLSQNLKNCKIAASETVCDTCMQQNAVINGQCVTSNNCQVFQNLNGDQICNQCQNLYYVSNGNCILGTIQNCNAYINQYQCQSCIPGFVNVQLSGGITQCLPITINSSCVLNLDFFQIGQLKCNSCSTQNNVLTSDPNIIPQTQCLQISLVPQCISYNIKGSLFQTFDLKCTSCDDKNFLYLNTCNPRKNLPITNCLTYNLSSDNCQQCEIGYFPSLFSCVKNPNGISKCINYSLSNACTQCDVNYFLSSNQCLQVPKSKLVNNCSYYNRDQTCQICQQLYVLNLNQCIQSKAVNCLTNLDVNNCLTCKPDTGLQKTNNITNCVIINIQNCASSTQVAPFQCTICEKQYYLVNNQCSPVSKIIINCLVYDTAVTCSKCSQNFVLSLTKTVCYGSQQYSNMIDINCNDSLEVTPFCSVCPMGFYFGPDNSCVACQNTDGCMSCSPDDIVCRVCLPGYYMDNNFLCNQWSKETFTVPNLIVK